MSTPGYQNIFGYEGTYRPSTLQALPSSFCRCRPLWCRPFYVKTDVSKVASHGSAFGRQSREAFLLLDRFLLPLFLPPKDGGQSPKSNGSSIVLGRMWTLPLSLAWHDQRPHNINNDARSPGNPYHQHAYLTMTVLNRWRAETSKEEPVRRHMQSSQCAFSFVKVV